MLIILVVGGWYARHEMARRKGAGVGPVAAPASVAAIPAGASGANVAAKSERKDDAGAELLNVKIDFAQTLAASAVARESWPEALQAYQDARKAQADLNQQFPTSPKAGAARLARLDAEIASLQASELAALSIKKEREGELAASRSRTADATAAFALAIEHQRELNERFPQHRRASVPRVEELVVRRDTALSASSLARVLELDREIDSLLRMHRGGNAGERVGDALALLDQTTSAFSRSRAPGTDLRLKLQYLGSRRDQLVALQQLISPRLLRLPGSPNVQLLITEVSQDVFQRVMGTNPSRSSGATLPVDSVTWAEANEFCRRVGWLLGAVVRLPTEAEFRVAATGATPDMWTGPSGAAGVQPVGKLPATPPGFKDTIGNVAEWLNGGPESGGTAIVAGGSYLDAADTLAKLPLVATDKEVRARHIGFRIAVEWSADR